LVYKQKSQNLVLSGFLQRVYGALKMDMGGLKKEFWQLPEEYLMNSEKTNLNTVFTKAQVKIHFVFL